jgi:uncharacterized protein
MSWRGQPEESGMARDDLRIEASETAGRGRYAAAVEGGAAELTYSRPDPHLMVIDHTYVPRPSRGRGVAAALVRRAVADARASGARILPLCSYAATVFRRDASLRDVLAR